jgi:hypothetical protein
MKLYRGDRPDSTDSKTPYECAGWGKSLRVMTFRMIRLRCEVQLAITVISLGLFLRPVSAQIPDKSKFNIHIVDIQRSQKSCTAEATTDTLKYKLSSDTLGPCSVLVAGENYKAARVSIESGGTPGDKSEDDVLLIVFNNRENSRWPEAAFQIQSESELTRDQRSNKSSDKSRPLGSVR